MGGYAAVEAFFYEVFEEERSALLRHLPAGIDIGLTPDTIQEAGHIEPPAGLISIRTQSVLPRQWSSRIVGLLSRSTGFDHVQGFLDGATREVPAGYLPLYCSISVAEQALLLWLGLMRKLSMQTRHFPQFDRDGLTGRECRGKTLLVAGVGNIGLEVCRIGSALGMEAIGVDIVRRHPTVRYVSIDEGLPRADVIVCAMNLTEHNHGYFHYGLLRKTRPGTIFVNIARGELSPVQDLLRLLEEGHLRGVGLDVYEDEAKLAVQLRSGKTGNKSAFEAVLALARHEHAILTPHNAFNTHEALERKAIQSIEQIEHFLRHGDFIWKVPI
jgi:D-lactate dehydrogenase